MADDELLMWGIVDIPLQRVLVHWHNCLGNKNAEMDLDIDLLQLRACMESHWKFVLQPLIALPTRLKIFISAWDSRSVEEPF